MNESRRQHQRAKGRHVPVARRIPIALSDELYERLMAVAGGTQVAARLVLEAALERAMRAESEPESTSNIVHAHRGNPLHLRALFGWTWGRKHR